MISQLTTVTIGFLSVPRNRNENLWNPGYLITINGTNYCKQRTSMGKVCMCVRGKSWQKSTTPQFVYREAESWVLQVVSADTYVGRYLVDTRLTVGQLSVDILVERQSSIDRHIGRYYIVFCRVLVDSRSMSYILSTDVLVDIGSMGYRSTVGGILVWCWRNLKYLLRNKQEPML